MKQYFFFRSHESQQNNHTAFRDVKLVMHIFNKICNSVFRDSTFEYIKASKTTIDDSCKFKISFDENFDMRNFFLDIWKRNKEPGFEWPKDPPFKIMLKAINGKFWYNHQSKNVITASRDKVCEGCKFSLEVMYPMCPTIKGVKPNEYYMKIIEAPKQVCVKDQDGKIHCGPIVKV